jgi:hypothetical protein
MSKGDRIQQDLLRAIRGALFFGVPNQGMNITSLIAMSHGEANENFCRTLGADSPILRDMVWEFPKAFPFEDSRIISFYETKLSPTAQIVRTRIVRTKSQLMSF